jgi:hypothetical protein
MNSPQHYRKHALLLWHYFSEAEGAYLFVPPGGFGQPFTVS